MSSNPAAPSPDPNLRSPEDPVSSSVHLWGLRLWIGCAILIVVYALTNYFLNHWLTK